MIRSFLIALAFLTIVPIRFRAPPTPEEVARSRYWYPIVGLLLGGALGSAAYGLSSITSPFIAGFLALFLWVVSSGALHLDGLADSCDGMFGGKDPQERLTIMADPHVGTFGVVMVVLILLGKYGALLQMAIRDGGFELAWRLGMSVVTARCLVLVIAGLAKYVRDQGTGKPVVEAATAWDVEAGLILVLGATWVSTHPAAVVALAAVLGWTWLCRSRLGGVTGDCLGAAIELAEATCLLSFAFSGNQAS